MNRKTMMLAMVSAVMLIQCGCETTTSPQKSEPPRKVEAPRKPVEKVDTPPQQPTPREQAVAMCKDLWGNVKPYLSNHDYYAARKVALSGRDKEDDKVAGMMLKFRIGLITSIINPAALEWRIGELNNKIDAFCSAGDFQSAYAILEKEKKHWEDAEFTDLDEALKKIQKELEALYYSDSALKEYIGKYRDEFERLINDRKGYLVMRDGVCREIDALETIIKNEMPDEQKSEVDKIVASMKDELGIRNLTTTALCLSISAQADILQDQVKSNQDTVKNNERRYADMIAMHLAAIRAKIAVKQSLSQGVDLNDEINAMENAAKRKFVGRGSLFAECARGLRTLLPANAIGQLNYQDLLSAAILLNRREIMEMAFNCGANVTTSAPNDPVKTPPLLLAVEVGSKRNVAWLCDKGAQNQIAPLSMMALEIATIKNRLDMFKYLQDIGCITSKADVQKLFALCCETGADNLHEYLYSIGAKPTVSDFQKAVNKADNLIIVKWFVESLYFNVNEPGLNPVVGGVRSYMVNRGMQL